MNLDLFTKRIIRKAVEGQRSYIQKGRSRNGAGVTSSTPIQVVDSNSAPILEGHPYLKTGFRNGPRFHKILYTPSTLRIEVGKDWIAKNCAGICA